MTSAPILSISRIAETLRAVDIKLLPPLPDAVAATFDVGHDRGVTIVWSTFGARGDVLSVDMALDGHVGVEQHVSTLERVNSWNQHARWPVAVYDTEEQRVVTNISVCCDADTTDVSLARLLVLSIDSNLQFVRGFGPVESDAAAGNPPHGITAVDLQRMFDL